MALTIQGSGVNQYLRARIRHTKPAPISFGTVTVTWTNYRPGIQYVDYMNITGTRFYDGNDFDSTTTATKSPEKDLPGSNANNDLVIDYSGLNSYGLVGTFTVAAVFEEGRCPKSATVTRVEPTATNVPLPTNTKTPVTPTNTKTPVTPTPVTPTSTKTPVTPTLTPTPITPTPVTPTKTNTPVTPTFTNTPVTPTIVPTVAPPTATKTPNGCVDC
jgi:hypothetical protein